MRPAPKSTVRDQKSDPCELKDLSFNRQISARSRWQADPFELRVRFTSPLL